MNHTIDKWLKILTIGPGGPCGPGEPGGPMSCVKYIYLENKFIILTDTVD